MHMVSNVHASLYFPMYTIYTLFQCVHNVCVCLDSLAYFPWAWAGSRPAELVLSEDWPHVGLCGRVKIEADTHAYIHTDTGQGFRLCVLLNSFKAPAEWPLFH